MAKKKKIILIIKPDYSKGNGHTDYSGYGPHKSINDKKSKRAKNKRDEQDIKKNPDLEI